jgi:hypothetical protein
MHGYSSSDESDDPRRPRSQPASSGNNQDQKKKRKKRLPPQQSINKVWKKFSNRKFHKALSVLPFDPVAPRSGLDRPNELLSEGYERAAEECRRKVQKIVQECKRVNMRYRDPGWDLVSDSPSGFPSLVFYFIFCTVADWLLLGLGSEVRKGQYPQLHR